MRLMKRTSYRSPNWLIMGSESDLEEEQEEDDKEGGGDDPIVDELNMLGYQDHY